MTIESCNDPGGIDSRLSIGTGTCGSLSCVASNDDACGPTTYSSSVTFAATGGTTYFIQWDDRWDDFAFDWELIFSAPPANDDCPGTDLATLTSPITENTCAAGNNIVTSCLTNTGAPDLLYFIDVPDGATLTIEQTSNTYDSKHRLAYGGACPGATEIVCVDDPDTQQAMWMNTTGSTQTVWWVQSAFSTGCGDFTLAWSVVSCTSPAASGTGIDDCPNNQFSVDVDLTSIGDASSVDIVEDVNGGGEVVVHNDVTTLQIYAMGPYAVGDNVNIRVLHNDDPACDLDLGSFSAGACPPANDDCANAITIACGNTLSGTTTNATVDGPACTGNSTAPGVWYTFVGANSGDPLALPGTPGDQVTMSTCNQANYDTKIDVYTGSCGALVCVGGNDDGAGCSGFTSEFGFATTVGTTYYVMISGFSAFSSGDFDLTMTCAPPCLPVPLNDNCGSAEVLAVAPNGTLVPTPGDNTCASSALGNPSCDLFANIQDVWFTFNSGAESQVIITANGLTMTDLNLVVYEGVCGGTEVFCQDPFSSPNNLPVTPGTDYFIQVYSDGAAGEGTFEIGVEAPPPPPANDTCANAIAVACNTLVAGSTEFANQTPEELNGCGTGDGAPGVWYTVNGFAGGMAASLCGSSYDTKIRVFDGSCGALNCIAGNDDFCGLQSEVSWTGVAGTTYYIQVFGFGSSTGTFTMEVRCGDQAPPCLDNEAVLEINTDDFGSETSWEIIPVGIPTPVCSGSGYPDNAQIFETCCLPDGCYRLRVLDSFGDGMTEPTGGYVLRDGNGNRIIDADDNPDFGSESSLANNGAFCLPLGTDRLIASQCDKEDFLVDDYLIASENPAVSAEFGVNDANSGYQFWMFDPHGSYTRRVFYSHANPTTGAPAGPMAAGYLRPQNLVTLPPPVDIVLNMRIRGRVNGTYSAFGPACRIQILSAPPACPETHLIDDVNNANFSCGVTRSFGGSDKVYAQPLAGATNYRFRFENVGEGYLRNIAGTSSARVLNWVTNPLMDGSTYDVTVQASFDGGSTYCPFGDVCQVTISNPPSAGTRVEQANDGQLAMWPNPNRGDQLYLTISELPDEEMTVNVDIYDLFGKRVAARTLTAQGGMLNTVMSLDGQLAAGMYMVNITAGDQLFTERLIIE